MDAKKLEILMTAIDLGSFSRASEVVGYTQSGLTHLVDSIEREMGLRLISRGHGGIRLTEEGEALMPLIRDYLRANALLEGRIKSMTEKRAEAIRVAAYASIAMHWMPEILYRFRRICPEVTVNLRMVDNALEPFELLERGETDVIFASRQDAAFCDWTPLYNETMYAILPKSYPLAGRTEFPLQEFEGLEFLMPYGRFDMDVKRAVAPVGISLKTTPSRVDDETLIRMVGRGLGVSMMSEFMIRGRTDDVLCVPVTPPSIRELGIGFHADRKMTDSLTALKTCVLAFVGEQDRGHKAF